MRIGTLVSWTLLASLGFAQGSVSYDVDIAKTRTLVAEHKFAEAIDASEKAIALDSQRWEAYEILATAYAGQQLYDDAISMLQMALGRAPQEKKKQIRDELSQVRSQLQSAVPPAAKQGSGSKEGTDRPKPLAAPAQTSQAEMVLWKTIDNSEKLED